jgi:L-asparaginase
MLKARRQANLRDAIRFACEKTGGVFLVFNGNVINGSRAVKIRTKSDNAFDSINFPLVARITEKGIDYQPDYKVMPEERQLKYFPRIAHDVILIKLMPGFGPSIFDYLKGNYRGVVIESFGLGGVPFLGESSILAKIEDLVRSGIIVVITTQCLLEGGNLNLFEVGRKILKSRILPAYDMTTEAAVTKLMWALGQASDFEAVRELFLTPVDCDLTLTDINA